MKTDKAKVAIPVLSCEDFHKQVIAKARYLREYHKVLLGRSPSWYLLGVTSLINAIEHACRDSKDNKGAVDHLTAAAAALMSWDLQICGSDMKDSDFHLDLSTAENEYILFEDPPEHLGPWEGDTPQTHAAWFNLIIRKLLDMNDRLHTGDQHAVSNEMPKVIAMVMIWQDVLLDSMDSDEHPRAIAA